MPASNDLVSIGVPVHNGGASLDSAVRSLLAQTHRNLEIIISDNASTDDTAEIAAALARADDRVRHHRQDQNIGAASNFRFVLGQAQGEFFMWAAADDSWGPTYVERNLAALQSDPTAVGSVSKVRWAGVTGPSGIAPGTFPLSGTVKQNVRRYLRSARDNSRFYGVFRREPLVRSYPDRAFFGIDLAVMVGTLRFGGHLEVDEVLMTRDRNDPAGYIGAVDVDNAPGIERWLPLLPFTSHVVQDSNIPMSPPSVALLVLRNVFEHMRYAAYRGSFYGRVCGALLRAAEPAQRRVVET